ALVASLAVAARAEEPNKPLPVLTPSVIPSLTPPKQGPPMPGQIPKELLEPILNKAAELAKVSREQLVIVRAEPAVWNDGSLGCPEPGMQYTQALVNGYWIVISAAGQTYDFRVGRGGGFQLCPAGRGHPPLAGPDAY
ncbi:MAG: hypothetical protein M3429_01775, partial [Verrucomicrobiota bacterium]|nr:hypothetical protein [Verrucomicrobiota bacterium]